MKVEMDYDSNQSELSENVNRSLRRLKKEGCEVIQMNYQATPHPNMNNKLVDETTLFSVMITYLEKGEIRDNKLNYLLKEE